MLTRRRFIHAAGAAVALLQFPLLARAQTMNIASALQETSLIYLTPIKSNGEESQCQAEIWFAPDGTDMFVCTSTESWRVRAVKKGLNKARVWIGDVGVWTGSNGRYKELPQVETRVEVIDDKAGQERALELFGEKYSMQWLVWGRRFRNGLEDGSRTMLRYRPV